MKKLFLLLLISFTAGASNWVPSSVIESHGVQAYQLESVCQLTNPPKCFDVGDEPAIVSEGFVSLTNDWGPQMEVVDCQGEEPCQIALQEKVCPGQLQKFIDAQFTKVYCVELLGKVLVKDEAGFAAHKAAVAAQASEQAQEQNALERMACGQKVIAKLLVRNSSKQLSVQQVGQLSSTYAPIQGLLLNGSLETAKQLIQAVQPDGVVVTEADKTALIEKLDSCKPN